MRRIGHDKQICQLEQLLQGLVQPNSEKCNFKSKIRNHQLKGKYCALSKVIMSLFRVLSGSYKFEILICLTQMQSYIIDLSSLKCQGHHSQQICTDVVIEIRQMTKQIFLMDDLQTITAYAIQRCCDMNQ
ncbi:hypothetical protein pb186bvf_003449 [Paramecium bursaria]